MLYKKLLIVSIFSISSCSTEIQSSSNRVIPQASSSTPIIIPNTSNPNNSNSNSSNKPKFTEPVTEAKIITPEIKVNSIQKVLKANDLEDYDFIKKEYDAGGIRVSAMRADNEFRDFPVAYTTNSLISSIGIIGLDNRDMSTISSTERAEVLEYIVKQIAIYNMRSNANKILENYRLKLNEIDAYSTDLAKEIGLLFYGNSDNKIHPNSISEISQNIDKENNLNLKTLDTISTGIYTITASAKISLDSSRTAREYIDKGLIRMLYFGILSNLANGEIDNSKNKTSEARSKLVSAEFYYMGIRNILKANGITSNSYLEEILSLKRFDILDYNKFEEGMNLGIAEKAKTDMLKSVSVLNTDFSLSKSLALSSKMYLDTISMEYKNSKYSRNKNNKIADIGNNFLNAVKLKNSKSANDNIKELSSIFNLVE